MIRGPCVVCYKNVTNQEARRFKRSKEGKVYAHENCRTPDRICAYKECRKSIHPVEMAEQGMHKSCAAAKRRDANREIFDGPDNATCFYTCDECNWGFDKNTDWCCDSGMDLCHTCNYKKLQVGTRAAKACSKPLMEAESPYIRSDGLLFCENCEDKHVDWKEETLRYQMRCDFWGIPR
jgi:hypothetical protein